MLKKTRKSLSKKYWYEFYHEECPVCGRVSDYKERRYTNKPDDASKRHHHVERYDWCDL